MGHQDLVSATESHTQDDRKHGEVGAKDTCGHGGNTQVHNNGGQYHLENLKAYRLDCGGNTNADPVRQNHAGTLEVRVTNFMVDFELQNDIQDDAGNQPGEHGGDGHALDAHLGKSQIAIQEDDVHDGVGNDGNDVSHQVPDGQSVCSNQGREGGLQGPEGKPEGDDVQELVTVGSRISCKSHPADDVMGQREGDEHDGNPQKEASQQDHGLGGASLAGTFSSHELGGNAGTCL